MHTQSVTELANIYSERKWDIGILLLRTGHSGYFEMIKTYKLTCVDIYKHISRKEM